jgi:nicotinate-nucleotide pyrophosphorylase (carboxylating)
VSDFDPPIVAVREIVGRALAEDLGALGDLTTIAVVPDETPGAGRFVVRRGGVVAGTASAAEVFHQVDPAVSVYWTVAEGDRVEEASELGRVEGPLRSILVAERTALNLLCHCSGVATSTRRFVDAVAGTAARIRDTRKTLPGLRALEKAAVRAGGGFNHRESLSDAVLVKDNHLAHRSLREAVDRARRQWPGRVVEVECDTLGDVAEAKAAGPDLVLLDNMSPEQVREAVSLLGGAAPVEVSGGVTLETAGAYAHAGADYVSVGAITHSAPALDIALDLE